MPAGVAAPFLTLAAASQRPRLGGINPPPGQGSAGGGGGGFGPPDRIPVCPAGTQWDPYVQACVAVGQGPTLTGTFSGTTSTITGTTDVTSTPPPVESTGPTVVNVTTNTAVALADNSASNAVQSVADAVKAGILASGGAAQTIADQTSNYIAQQLAGYSTTIAGGINDAFTGIGDVLNGVQSGIQDTLGGIGATIGNQLFQAVNPVSSALTNIVGIISAQIGGLAGQIGQAVAQVIPAIVAAVSNPIGAITGVLGTIESDIGRSVAQLTQVGSDISGGFTTLDATLGRILTSWEAYNTGFVEANTGYGQGETLHGDFSKVAAAIAGLVTTLVGHPTVRLSDAIEAPCQGTLFRDALDAQPDLQEFGDHWWTAFLYGICKVYIWFQKGQVALEKGHEGVRQKMNLACPQKLLSPEQLVEAVQRGFLPQDQAVLEAARGDLDSTRFLTLQSLAFEQMPSGQLVEALYRGLITQADYNTALTAQGWTPGQQNILQGLGVRLLSVGDLTELYRRGQLDRATLDTALAALQFDKAQRTALVELAYRPAHMQEAIDGGLASDALSQMGLLGEVGPDRIPEYVATAAAAEGLSVDAMNARWLSHFSTGSVGNWITLYFRGLVSLDSLRAVMARSYIPPSLQTTLIEAARPLVQYRTISNMLRIGQLDIQTAGQYLLKHGYTQQDVQLLITYAQRPGAQTNPKKAQALHAVSLGIAHEEYIDGSISENDYYQILLQHGYTIDGANTEISVVNAKQALLTRKQNAQLVVDEYGAGLINEQTALAQLAAQGLTVYELAKYTHRIKVFRVKGAKHPSEADLNHFLQLSIIDANTYKAQLEAQGYPANVAEWFYQYRIHPAATTAPSATLSPSSTVGS